MNKVLFIGDSWGYYLGKAADEYKIIEKINSNWTIDYEKSAIIGSTASKFVRNYDNYMDITIEKVKDSNVKLIIFSLGGNDFYNLGHFNDLSNCEDSFIEDSYKKIINNINTIIEEIRKYNQSPIVISGYDYFNINKLVDLFTPETKLKKISTRRFNDLKILFGKKLEELSFKFENCIYTTNWGLIQNSIDNNRYSFPFGNIDEPTPLEKIPDGMHPTLDGYKLLLESSLKQAKKRFPTILQ